MIATLLAGLGMDFITDLIKDKGEDLVIDGIKKVTGIDLSKKKELTPDEIIKIKDAEFKIKNLEFQNTDSARKMNSEIQTSEFSSSLAKNAAYYIDFAIIGATIILALCLFILEIPIENTDIANIVFGALLAQTTTIINFHRGSTQGSRDKSAIIHKRIEEK